MAFAIKYPRKQFDAEKPVPVVRRRFAGMIKDAPASELPDGYSALLKNVYAFGDWEEGRPGSRLYTATKLPQGRLYASGFHEKSKKVFIFTTSRVDWMILGMVYYSSQSMDNWTAVPILGELPVYSTGYFEPYGDYMYLFTSSGIYRIVMNDGVYGYKINTSVPTTAVSDYVEETADWKQTVSDAVGASSSVAFGNGVFVALAPLTGHTYAKISTDGKTWSDSVYEIGTSHAFTKVRYCNNLFIAVGPTQYIATSTDGTTWMIRDTGDIGISLNGVAYGDGKYVAVGNGWNGYYCSTDAITWTRGPESRSNNWLDIVFGNGLFVAVTSSGTATQNIITSTDGITWTDRSMPEAVELDGVAYGNGVYVAVGKNNVEKNIIYSYDAITWNAVNPGVAIQLYSVAYTGSYFCAVGDSSKVLTSTDGITWTAADAAVGSRWVDVTVGLEHLVAVSYTLAVKGSMYRAVTASSYGYKHLYALAKITGNSLNTRLTSGAVLEWESGTTKIDSTGKDFGVSYFSEEINPNQASAHTIGTLTHLIAATHATSFSIYRSLNISKTSTPPGIDPVTGLGNNSEGIFWVKDVPLCKSFMASVSGTVLTVTAGTISSDDIGNAMADISGTSYGVITAVSATTITVSVAGGNSADKAFVMGNGRLGMASQEGTVFTIVNDVVGFIPDNTIVFWCDGTMSIISGYDGSTADALVSASHSSQPFVVAPLLTGFTRMFNDTVPDVGADYGVEGLLERSKRGNRVYIPARFFEALPDSNIGHLLGGFMVVATRGATKYYYSQYSNKPHNLGYYRLGVQEAEAKAAITMLWLSVDKIVFFLINKTFALQTNFSTNVGNTEVGDDVYQLSELTLIDDAIGVKHWETIRQMHGPNQSIAVTSEPAVRVFLGDRWDTTDLAYSSGLPAVVKDLKWINAQPIAFASYAGGREGGYKIWGREEYGSYLCLRLAVMQPQGFGWSQIVATAWLCPVANGGILMLTDSNGNERCVVVDHAADFQSKVFEEGTYDAATADGTPPYTDKEGDSEEAEIATESWGPEIIAEPNEDYEIETECTHEFLRPQDPANRGRVIDGGVL